MKKLFLIICCFAIFFSCEKENEKDVVKPNNEPLLVKDIKVNDMSNGLTYLNINPRPIIELQFNMPVDKASISEAISFSGNKEGKIALSHGYKNADSSLIIMPTNVLSELSEYTVSISKMLRSPNGNTLAQAFTIKISTSLDSTNKFPVISDEELLTLVQKQTFKYFWDFGHPTSGMARERTTSGNTVTTGGTGFGIMAMIVASERQFVPRNEAVARIQKIVSFLKNKCTSYHGAYAHWINGETGATQPFSTKDNGADLLETSFLFQGLLAARQYFNNSSNEEKQLREGINDLWHALDWNWFRKNNQNALYWHWSTNYEWDMNMQITGWNECLITYILAASSPSHAIPTEVYDQGWARNGAMKNGQSYFGHQLPLGSAYGGPLFFTHYSFLGLNPKGLSDQYADYWEQNTNHAKINYSHCVENPGKFAGYSADCWGLTACDGNNGYSAHSPTNDRGVIAPTATLASMPYTPVESMKALHFFYYKLGNKIWKENGFVDGFNLGANWFDNQFLAIDQGPIVVMIENYRTGLIWETFMSCPEIQSGLTKLGFSYQTQIK